MEGNYMIHLLLLVITSSIIATENYPAILSHSHMDYIVVSKKDSAKKSIILNQSMYWKNEQDFYDAPDNVKNKIHDRITQFEVLNKIIEESQDRLVIQDDHDYLQGFYPHHGNLLIVTVNNAVNNGDSSGFLDLFEELLKIPELKVKQLAWLEINYGEKHIQQKYGNICDYLELYQSQIRENQETQSQRSIGILQEFLQKVSSNPSESM
jgi:hypothetical protein